jgi:hypothetical protein
MALCQFDAQRPSGRTAHELAQEPLGIGERAARR